MTDKSSIHEQTLRSLIDSSRDCRATGALYRFEKLAGRGQTGTVIKAIRRDQDGYSAQAVALKILRDSRAVHRLRREFDVLNSISSPYCAKVLSWETFDFGPALVFEWIDGVSLLEAARAGLLRREWTETIIAQVQEGLRVLHSLGLHHGDLAPTNVLIDRSGTLRLVDFASAPESSTEIYGTPAYLAPERWRGAPCSREADLFALGLIRRDLETNFEKTPSDLDDCRARSISLSAVNDSLLNEVPSVRAFSSDVVHSDDQRALAEAISTYLDSERSSGLQTRSIEVEPRKRIRLSRAASVIVLFGFSAMISVRADAPLVPKSPIPKSRLLITSQRWLRLSINGKEIGFAPVTVGNLHPGTYRITWQGASTRGTARVQLKPEETLRLNDRDLARLE